MDVTKVIIPAAGFGTRFLPQTKALPKEMLPIIDKPVIQYVVEEAVESGIKDVIIITGWHKRAIEDHFDYSYELEKRLNEWGKQDLIPEITRIAELANFIYIRQKGPYGNATPIKCAEHIVNKEPFMVLWGDDFVLSNPPRTFQMKQAFKKYKATILCCLKKDKPEDATRYGYIKGKEVEKGIWKVEKIIEKPGLQNMPSQLASVSGYLLTPDIFPILHNQKPGKGGEYYLPEALDTLAKTKPIYALEIKDGVYYDTSNKFEYLKTCIAIASQNEVLRSKLLEYFSVLQKKR